MPSGVQQNFALFMEDQIQWQNLTITPGLRYDFIRNIGQENIAPVYNDLTAGHDYSPVIYQGLSEYLGLQYHFTPDIKTFVNLSHTWRAPVIDESYTVQCAKVSVSASSRNLKPEQLYSIQAGLLVNKENLLFENDHLQLRATAFATRGKDEIFQRRGLLCSKATDKPLELL